MDTIFALATASGKAGIAIVRLSGPQAYPCASKIGADIARGGRGVREITSIKGDLIDQALVLGFAKGASFTGEDVVELHLHGSPAITGAVLGTLGDFPELRQAEPGEFTRRALENGCIDLAQVEGLSDLLEAETEAQRRQAMRVFSGAMGEKSARWRDQLIRAAALIEATIDFADEDVPQDVTPEVVGIIKEVRSELAAESAGVAVAERIRDGFEVAIVGAPNVGKSTLLNRLAGREAAITSAIAGTTRDVIEVRMDLKGLPVTFLDTAGLRASDDEVESIGIERARSRAAQADLRIYMLMPDDKIDLNLDESDIVVHSKADLNSYDSGGISGHTGEGIDQLVDQVTTELLTRTARVGVAMKERHRVALERTITYLDRAEQELATGHGLLDIVAEELRSAVRAIDSLIGRVDVEDLLDEIFSRFCLGK